MTVPENFRDNPTLARFELTENGLTAFAEYRRRGRSLAISHVESPPLLRGKGTAGRLMQAVTAHARAEEVKILPLCGYARAWFRRHPDATDVLEPSV